MTQKYPGPPPITLSFYDSAKIFVFCDHSLLLDTGFEQGFFGFPRVCGYLAAKNLRKLRNTPI